VLRRPSELAAFIRHVESRPAVRVTPALVSGVTDHVWDISEIEDLLDISARIAA
jgi:hypothetical protein